MNKLRVLFICLLLIGNAIFLCGCGQESVIEEISDSEDVDKIELKEIEEEPTTSISEEQVEEDTLLDFSTTNWKEGKQYYDMLEGDWVITEYAGQITYRHYYDDGYDEAKEKEDLEREKEMADEIISENMGRRFQIGTEKMSYFGPISELGYIMEDNESLLFLTNFAHLDFHMIPPYIGVSVGLKEEPQYYDFVIDAEGTVLVEIHGCFFRLEKASMDKPKEPTEFLRTNWKDGETYFYMLEGEWVVTRCVGSKESYLSNKEDPEEKERYRNEVTEANIGRKISVTMDDLQYFGPLPYYWVYTMDDDDILSVMARFTPTEIKMTAPYVGVRMRLNGMPYYNYIMDADGTILVEIDDYFFQLEKQ